MKKIKLIKNFSSLFLKANKAQGILEVVIAISIVVVGLVSIMSLVVFNVTTQDYNHDMLIASNLAREGIEVIRSMRDSNWLDSTKDWDDSIFMEGASYSDKNSFIIFNRSSWDANDFSYGLVSAGVFWEDCIINEFGRLYFTPIIDNSGHEIYNYGYDLDGVLIPDARASNFYRLIYINEICDVEVEGVEEILTGYAERCEGEGYSKIGMQIISKVGWMNKGKMRTLEAEERLYNWK